MVFIDGPKKILASAIAKALDDHFVVDASKLESSLLSDARIVLRNVELREIVTTRPKKDEELPPTLITVNGSVEEVAFTWEWAIGKTFVKNAKLSLKNVHCTGKLVDDSSCPDENEVSVSNSQDVDVKPEDEPLDEKTSKEVQKEGGWKSFVMKHVNMMIDALTLHVDGLVVTLEVPDQTSSSTRALTPLQKLEIGLESIRMISLGRDGDPETQTGTLRQTAEILGFFAKLIKGGGDNPKVTPFIEPFSYGAEVVTATGPRFGNFARGVKLTGAPRNRDDDMRSPAGFVFNFGTAQAHALKMLGVMLLSPPPSEASSTKELDDCFLPHLEEGDIDTLSSVQEVSCFDFSFPCLTLADNDTGTFRLGGSVTLRYLGDGSLLKIDAGDFAVTKNAKDGWLVHGKGIHVENLVEKKAVRVDEVDTINVPNRFELLTSVMDTIVSLQGQIVTAQIAHLEGTFLSGPPKSGDDVSASSSSWNGLASSAGSRAFSGSAQNVHKNWMTPCPICTTFEKLTLFRDRQIDTVTVLKEAELSLKQADDASGTEIVIALSEVNRKLISGKHVRASLVLPLFGMNILEDLNATAESVSLKSGHSKEEWDQAMLRNPGSLQIAGSKASKKEAPGTNGMTSLHLPFAHVDTLCLNITVQGTGLSLKETSIVVKPFVGRETTTAYDLASYYAMACLWKIPSFITNADVLGLNMADAGSTIVDITKSVGQTGHKAASVVANGAFTASHKAATAVSHGASATAGATIDAVKLGVERCKISASSGSNAIGIQSFLDRACDLTQGDAFDNKPSKTSAIAGNAISGCKSIGNNVAGGVGGALGGIGGAVGGLFVKKKQ